MSNLAKYSCLTFVVLLAIGNNLFLVMLLVVMLVVTLVLALLVMMLVLWLVFDNAQVDNLV